MRRNTNLPWAPTHKAIPCVGVLPKASQLEGSNVRIWTLVLRAPSSMLPYPAVSLLLWDLLYLPYSKEPDHLNSMFPIWAKHVPTQCKNIFMTKTVFLCWTQHQHLCTCSFPREEFFHGATTQFAASKGDHRPTCTHKLLSSSPLDWMFL